MVVAGGLIVVESWSKADLLSSLLELIGGARARYGGTRALCDGTRAVSVNTSNLGN